LRNEVGLLRFKNNYLYHYKERVMEFAPTKPGYLLILLIISLVFAQSCTEPVTPLDLPGTYTGKERVLLRYDKDGQYIYRDEIVMVSLIIDSKGEVTGMVGEAAFEGCNTKSNRGWLSHTLNIKTDFIIKGKLIGKTFEKDSIQNKNISIPFNIKNGELRGSLFLNNTGQNYPVIRILKLKKI